MASPCQCVFSDGMPLFRKACDLLPVSPAKRQDTSWKPAWFAATGSNWLWRIYGWMGGKRIVLANQNLEAWRHKTIYLNPPFVVFFLHVFLFCWVNWGSNMIYLAVQCYSCGHTACGITSPWGELTTDRGRSMLHHLTHRLAGPCWATFSHRPSRPIPFFERHNDQVQGYPGMTWIRPRLRINLHPSFLASVERQADKRTKDTKGALLGVTNDCNANNVCIYIYIDR